MANIVDSYIQFYAKDRKMWRNWLGKNHDKSPGVWLICYKKGSGKPNVTYNESVEEALCFGWIDSTKRPGNEEYYLQMFTPRKATSGWSKINKDRIERLIAQGLMTPAGLEKIESARQNGTWNKLDHIELFTVPPELERAFKTNKAARKFFEGLANSDRKGILHWISMAKREETRAKRIDALLQAASEGKKPAHFDRPVNKTRK